MPSAGGLLTGAPAPRIAWCVGLVVAAVLLAGCTETTGGIAVGAADLGHAAAPVSVSALEGLLLPPEQLNSLLTTSGLVVQQSNSTGFGGETTANDCAVTWQVAWRPSYTGSGWTAMRVHYLTEGDLVTHKVWEAVVGFPLPVDATAFYRNQVAAWRSCNGRRLEERLVDEPAGPQKFWSMGDATDHDGVLTMMSTNEYVTAWGCGRALTVRNNVAVDTLVCAAPPGGLAESVAKTIAQKIP